MTFRDRVIGIIIQARGTGRRKRLEGDALREWINGHYPTQWEGRRKSMGKFSVEVAIWREELERFLRPDLKYGDRVEFESAGYNFGAICLRRKNKSTWIVAYVHPLMRGPKRKPVKTDVFAAHLHKRTWPAAIDLFDLDSGVIDDAEFFAPSAFDA